MPDRVAERSYRLIDSTVGSRLALGFVVPVEALQSRLPVGWQPSSVPPPAYRDAMLTTHAGGAPTAPNLLLVFNDLLLNQGEQGSVQVDANARYVGFNIPAAKPDTAERGMVHFRIFTGNPYSVPGRYRDALLARVRHESRVTGEGTASIVHEDWLLEPDTGGTIELRLSYARGPLSRIVSDQPNFPVWAAADTSILRVYQEDTLFEVVRNGALGVDRVQDMNTRIGVPELADLFSGDEKLVTIFANPHYTRRVFSPAADCVADSSRC